MNSNLRKHFSASIFLLIAACSPESLPIQIPGQTKQPESSRSIQPTGDELLSDSNETEGIGLGTAEFKINFPGPDEDKSRNEPEVVNAGMLFDDGSGLNCEFFARDLEKYSGRRIELEWSQLNSMGQKIASYHVDAAAPCVGPAAINSTIMDEAVKISASVHVIDDGKVVYSASASEVPVNRDRHSDGFTTVELK